MRAIVTAKSQQRNRGKHILRTRAARCPPPRRHTSRQPGSTEDEPAERRRRNQQVTCGTQQQQQQQQQQQLRRQRPQAWQAILQSRRDRDRGRVSGRHARREGKVPAKQTSDPTDQTNHSSSSGRTEWGADSAPLKLDIEKLTQRSRERRVRRGYIYRKRESGRESNTSTRE